MRKMTSSRREARRYVFIATLNPSLAEPLIMQKQIPPDQVVAHT